MSKKKTEKRFGHGDRVIYRLHKYHTPYIGTVMEYDGAGQHGAPTGYVVLADYDGRHYRVSDATGFVRKANRVDELWHNKEAKRKRARAHEQSQDMNRTPGQRNTPAYKPMPIPAPKKKPSVVDVGGMMAEEINKGAKK